MRVFLGIILGVILTVTVAFIADSWSNTPTATTGSSATVAQRPMVNWDVVGDNMRSIRVRANHVWDRLNHRLAG